MELVWWKKTLCHPTVLPEGESSSVGIKYIQNGINLFANDYLRAVIENKPELNDYLRVLHGETEFRDYKIAPIDEKKLRRDDLDLNKVF